MSDPGLTSIAGPGTAAVTAWCWMLAAAAEVFVVSR